MRMKQSTLQLVETLQSFNQAVSNAGGAPYTLSRLQETTLAEFLAEVAAPNGIRFYYTPPPSEDKA